MKMNMAATRMRILLSLQLGQDIQGEDEFNGGGISLSLSDVGTKI